VILKLHSETNFKANKGTASFEINFDEKDDAFQTRMIKQRESTAHKTNVHVSTHSLLSRPEKGVYLHNARDEKA